MVRKDCILASEKQGLVQFQLLYVNSGDGVMVNTKCQPDWATGSPSICAYMPGHDSLCSPMDLSPSGSSVREILRARILEWIAKPSSRKERKKVKLLHRVWLFVTPWTVAYQVPPSMGFSRQEYWSGSPFPYPGDLPDPGIGPWVSGIVGRCFTVWASREVLLRRIFPTQGSNLHLNLSFVLLMQALSWSDEGLLH